MQSLNFHQIITALGKYTRGQQHTLHTRAEDQIAVIISVRAANSRNEHTT